jgi:hypothetical protein
MGSLLWNSLWLIAVVPHRGGSISLRPDGEVTSSRRSSHRRSGVDHDHRCRLLLDDQRARAGKAWSGTSPHANVTRVGIKRRPYQLLLPMPTLLTACTRGTDSVTCRPRWSATPAEKRGNRGLGRLPMRNGSQHGKAHPCESANSCMYNIRLTAPVNESLPSAETFYGIVYRANRISLYVLYVNHASLSLCFLQPPPCRLWYDGDAHAS